MTGWGTFLWRTLLHGMNFFKTTLRRCLIGNRYLVRFAETVLGIPNDICLNLPRYITLKHGIICCNRTLLSPSRSAHTDQLWWSPNLITVCTNTAVAGSLNNLRHWSNTNFQITIFYGMTPCNCVNRYPAFRKNLLPHSSGKYCWMELCTQKMEAEVSRKCRRNRTIFYDVIFQSLVTLIPLW